MPLIALQIVFHTLGGYFLAWVLWMHLQAKRELKMTRRNVYSRAYHFKLCRSNQKELARQYANEAVKMWEEGK